MRDGVEVDLNHGEEVLKQWAPVRVDGDRRRCAATLTSQRILISDGREVFQVNLSSVHSSGLGRRRRLGLWAILASLISFYAAAQLLVSPADFFGWGLGIVLAVSWIGLGRTTLRVSFGKHETLELEALSPLLWQMNEQISSLISAPRAPLVVELTDDDLDELEIDEPMDFFVTPLVPPTQTTRIEPTPMPAAVAAVEPATTKHDPLGPLRDYYAAQRRSTRTGTAAVSRRPTRWDPAPVQQYENPTVVNAQFIPRPDIGRTASALLERANIAAGNPDEHGLVSDRPGSWRRVSGESREDDVTLLTRQLRQQYSQGKFGGEGGLTWRRSPTAAPIEQPARDDYEVIGRSAGPDARQRRSPLADRLAGLSLANQHHHQNQRQGRGPVSPNASHPPTPSGPRTSPGPSPSAPSKMRRTISRTVRAPQARAGKVDDFMLESGPVSLSQEEMDELILRSTMA